MFWHTDKFSVAAFVINYSGIIHKWTGNEQGMTITCIHVMQIIRWNDVVQESLPCFFPTLSVCSLLALLILCSGSLVLNGGEK